MTDTNFHQVTSPAQFQQLLSDDLNRASLINFWAPWAEPCTQMNEVVSELAKKYKTVLVLQVEAESQPEISESFDVESVPTFVILRGHNLLDRITGADAVTLMKCLAKHAGTISAVTPLSKTSQAPAPPSATAPAADEIPGVSQSSQDRLRKLMNTSQVVLFMKGSPDAPRCGFSRQVVALLREQGIEFSHFDILTDDGVRQGLKVMNDWPTFPQIIVNGELIGGLDVAKEMVENGELAEILK